MRPDNTLGESSMEEESTTGVPAQHEKMPEGKGEINDEEGSSMLTSDVPAKGEQVIVRRSHENEMALEDAESGGRSASRAENSSNEEIMQSPRSQVQLDERRKGDQLQRLVDAFQKSKDLNQALSQENYHLRKLLHCDELDSRDEISFRRVSTDNEARGDIDSDCFRQQELVGAKRNEEINEGDDGHDGASTHRRQPSTESDRKMRGMQQVLHGRTQMMKVTVNDLQTEIREVAQNMRGRIAGYGDELEKLNDEKKKNEKKLAEQDRVLDAVKAENNNLKKQNHTLNTSIAGLRDRLESLENSRDASTGTTEGELPSVLKQVKETHSKKMEEMEQQLNAKEATIASLQQEVAECIKKSSARDKQLERSKLSLIEKESSLKSQVMYLEVSKRKAVEALEGELKSLKESLEEKNSILKTKINNLEESKRKAVESLEKKLEDVMKRNSSLKLELEGEQDAASRSNEEHLTTIERLKSKNTVLEDAKNEVEAQLSKKIDSLEECQRSLVESLEKESKIRDEYAIVQKKLLDATNSKEEVEAKFRTQLESLEAYKLDMESVTRSLRKELMEANKSAKDTRAKLGSAYDDLETHYNSRIASLEKNLQNSLKIEEELRTKLKGKDEIESKVVVQEELVKSLRGEMEDTKTEVMKSRDELEHARKENEEFSSKLEKQAVYAETIKEELVGVNAQFVSLQGQNKALEADLAKAKSTLRASQSRSVQDASVIERAQAATNTLHQELQESKNAAQKLKRALAKASDRNMVLENEMNMQAQEVLSLKTELRQTKEELTQQYEEYKEEAEKAHLDHMMKLARYKNQDIEIDELIQRVSAYETMSSSLVQDFAARLEVVEDNKQHGGTKFAHSRKYVNEEKINSKADLIKFKREIAGRKDQIRRMGSEMAKVTRENDDLYSQNEILSRELEFWKTKAGVSTICASLSDTGRDSFTSKDSSKVPRRETILAKKKQAQAGKVKEHFNNFKRVTTQLKEVVKERERNRERRSTQVSAKSKSKDDVSSRYTDMKSVRRTITWKYQCFSSEEGDGIEVVGTAVPREMQPSFKVVMEEHEGFVEMFAATQSSSVPFDEGQTDLDASRSEVSGTRAYNSTCEVGFAGTGEETRSSLSAEETHVRFVQVSSSQKSFSGHEVSSASECSSVFDDIVQRSSFDRAEVISAWSEETVVSGFFGEMEYACVWLGVLAKEQPLQSRDSFFSSSWDESSVTDSGGKFHQTNRETVHSPKKLQRRRCCSCGAL